MQQINAAGLNIIKSYEGILDGDPATVNLDPYLCPAGVWTIGWGHALRKGGQLLRGKENKAVAFAMFPGGVTLAKAEVMLRNDAEDASTSVETMVTSVLTLNQFSALVSLVFNIGAGNFKKSTLLAKLNAGKYDDAAREFARWNMSNGEVLRGLVARREAERKLFCTP